MELFRISDLLGKLNSRNNHLKYTAMKGKMMLLLGVLLIGSYFLYEWRGNPQEISQRRKQTASYISGKVTGANGNPISKVTVYLLGSDRNTTSDSDGKYSIQAVVGDELVFSHPKYTTLSIEVKDTVQNVTLQPKDTELTEQIRRDFPGVEIR